MQRAALTGDKASSVVRELGSEGVAGEREALEFREAAQSLQERKSLRGKVFRDAESLETRSGIELGFFGFFHGLLGKTLDVARTSALWGDLRAALLGCSRRRRPCLLGDEFTDSTDPLCKRLLFPGVEQGGTGLERELLGDRREGN